MSDHAPRSIEQYLSQLQKAMENQDSAVIQDALYDAEEYLRAEVAQHPDKSEADVLEAIAVSYGAPDEVADAYIATEATVQAALKPPEPVKHDSLIGRFFSVYMQPQAYSSLFYMLLALATGIIYFTVAITGMSMSVGLMVLIIGIPFFLLFIATARVLALVEGRIVETCLGVRMPRRPSYLNRDLPFFERIKNMLVDSRTWSTLLYLVLMLPLGVLYFVVAVVSVTVPLAVIAEPIVSLLDDHGYIYISGNALDLPLWMAPFQILLGVILLTAALHLFKGIGKVHGHVAKSLLVMAPGKN